MPAQEAGAAATATAATADTSMSDAAGNGAEAMDASGPGSVGVGFGDGLQGIGPGQQPAASYLVVVRTSGTLEIYRLPGVTRVFESASFGDAPRVVAAAAEGGSSAGSSGAGSRGSSAVVELRMESFEVRGCGAVSCCDVLDVAAAGILDSCSTGGLSACVWGH